MPEVQNKDNSSDLSLRRMRDMVLSCLWNRRAQVSKMWKKTEMKEIRDQMTNGAKKIGLYAGIGILVAILIISGVGFSGLKFPSLKFPDFFHPPSPPSTTGTLIIKISDKPVNLTHLNLTVDNISAHRKGYGNETWVDLAFVNDVSEVTFDLLVLQNVTMDLSITEIPSGNYTQIRMHVREANATYADNRTDVLKVPSEYLKIIIHFTIEAGQETTLLIDVQPNWNAIIHSGHFAPVLKATVIS